MLAHWAVTPVLLLSYMSGVVHTQHLPEAMCNENIKKLCSLAWDSRRHCSLASEEGCEHY